MSAPGGDHGNGFVDEQQENRPTYGGYDGDGRHYAYPNPTMHEMRQYGGPTPSQALHYLVSPAPQRHTRRPRRAARQQLASLPPHTTGRDEYLPRLPTSRFDLTARLVPPHIPPVLSNRIRAPFDQQRAQMPYSLALTAPISDGYQHQFGTDGSLHDPYTDGSHRNGYQPYAAGGASASAVPASLGYGHNRQFDQSPSHGSGIGLHMGTSTQGFDGYMHPAFSGLEDIRGSRTQGVLGSHGTGSSMVERGVQGNMPQGLNESLPTRVRSLLPPSYVLYINQFEQVQYSELSDSDEGVIDDDQKITTNNAMTKGSTAGRKTKKAASAAVQKPPRTRNSRTGLFYKSYLDASRDFTSKFRAPKPDPSIPRTEDEIIDFIDEVTAAVRNKDDVTEKGTSPEFPQRWAEGGEYYTDQQVEALAWTAWEKMNGLHDLGIDVSLRDVKLKKSVEDTSDYLFGQRRKAFVELVKVCEYLTVFLLSH